MKDSFLLQAVLVFLVLNLPRTVLMAFEVDRIIKYEKCLVSNWKLSNKNKSTLNQLPPSLKHEFLQRNIASHETLKPLI